MTWGSDNTTQLITCLMLFAGGAACGALYDAFSFLEKVCPRRAVCMMLDVCFVAVCAAVILILWYEADRIHLHYLPLIFTIFGAIIYRLGVGFYVRLWVEKLKNTRCCMPVKNPKKL